MRGFPRQSYGKDDSVVDLSYVVTKYLGCRPQGLNTGLIACRVFVDQIIFWNVFFSELDIHLHSFKIKLTKTLSNNKNVLITKSSTKIQAKI